jgi:hypothetical protein
MYSKYGLIVHVLKIWTYCTCTQNMDLLYMYLKYRLIVHVLKYRLIVHVLKYRLIVHVLKYILIVHALKI